MILQISQIFEILSQTPQTLQSLLGTLSADWVYATAEDGGWSSFDIVGHYIHAEETNWIPRAEIILAQGENRTFAKFDRFAQFEKSKGKTLIELLETFARLRQESLQTLKSWNLSDADLKLKGTHPELGEVTLEQLLSTWAVHDLTYLRQIATVLAKQYAENVGAWKEYLSILK